MQVVVRDAAGPGGACVANAGAGKRTRGARAPTVVETNARGNAGRSDGNAPQREKADPGGIGLAKRWALPGFVRPRAGVALGRVDPRGLAHCGDGSPDAVLPPAGGFHDLLQRGSVFPRDQCEDRVLLAGPGPFVVFASLVDFAALAGFGALALRAALGSASGAFVVAVSASDPASF